MLDSQILVTRPVSTAFIFWMACEAWQRVSCLYLWGTYAMRWRRLKIMSSRHGKHLTLCAKNEEGSKNSRRIIRTSWGYMKCRQISAHVWMYNLYKEDDHDQHSINNLDEERQPDNNIVDDNLHACVIHWRLFQRNKTDFVVKLVARLRSAQTKENADICKPNSLSISWQSDPHFFY